MFFQIDIIFWQQCQAIYTRRDIRAGKEQKIHPSLFTTIMKLVDEK